MVLGLGLTSESPAGIVDMQISDSVVGKGVGFSISNSFPGDADPKIIENLWCRQRSCSKNTRVQVSALPYTDCNIEHDVA